MMRCIRYIVFGLYCGVLLLASNSLWADNPIDDLLRSSCLECHDGQNDTGFQLSDVPVEFDKPELFETWVKVYDRVQRGEMPPATAKQPDSSLRQDALSRLRGDLTQANLLHR